MIEKQQLRDLYNKLILASLIPQPDFNQGKFFNALIAHDFNFSKKLKIDFINI
jgi:hypothetical protein